ncbi:MAG TPA: sensor histidine kinase [Lachnoclostridium sp.]|jgi:two-component system sensor histidine kinase CiaH|uniref:sensor histidine kinase n=1 Tax=Lacrimispora sp. TaxID=2719234 RepID=UPI000EBC49B0|nr:HAMP domain-containing sensor histidine kinase [Lacrimispora sp.]HCD43926.1 sensor histidine kinase [Lachnoclostridium sp.]
MIKKLRRRFVLINMVFVISILSTVLGIFYYASFKRIERQTVMALLQASDHNRPDRLPDKVEITRRPQKNLPPLIPVFVVTLNSRNTIENIRENNITVSKDQASTLVELAKADGSLQGELKDYSLRYLKVSSTEGTKIVFADQRYERNNLKTLLIYCLLVFFAAVFLFLILSIFLSRLALKPVENAWRMQNQFIADASHELKTPLTVILANLQILSLHKECTIMEQQKWLDNTKEESERMKQLVEELLFLARSDTGAVQAQAAKASMDFSDIVLNGVLLFESVAFENKVKLENEIEPGIILEGWDVQLKQVITILLDNACKYAGKNGSVSVRLKKSSHYAVLAVKNTGTPIPEKEQSHVFERFYRTDESRVRKEGGYGLGLSIAQTIVDHHKGKISLTSGLETGTVFTVSLPLPSRQHLSKT